MSEGGAMENLASVIDHTLLKANATAAAIRTLCEEAVEHRFFSVCVHGVWVPYCRELLQGTGIKISVVCGFPLGANASRVKAFEANLAAEQGAHEIDMVLQAGLLLEGRFKDVEEDIRQVVKSVEGQAIVKVILETGLLNNEQKAAACRLSEQAGAHYVKTSTGFGPGGATVEDIRLMREHVSPHIGVKASGGVRDALTAGAMLEAGATRLGTSAGVAIVQGQAGQSGY